MKRKVFSTLFALVLICSLVMAVPMAAGANGTTTLDVGVNAWVKDAVTHELTPLYGCIEPGSDFYINATVVASGGTVTGVKATISIGDRASLDPAESTDPKSLGDIEACRLQDVWWKLHCDGPGSVPITVTASGDAGGTITGEGSTTVTQCTPDPCPVVIVEIIEPLAHEITVDPCQTFAVKALIQNTGDCARSITGVTSTITLDGGNADVVAGMPYTWNLEDMEPGDIHEVGWTVHCAASGDVTITVDAGFTGEDTGEVVDDDVLVHQTPEECFFADITAPLNGVDVCVDCGTFPVDAVIYNDCDVALEGVTAELAVSGGVDITPPPNQYLGDIAANSTTPVSWVAGCTAAGAASFTLTVNGYEAGTGELKTATDMVAITQTEFLVDITTPVTSTTFSTEQTFPVTAHFKNCTGADLTNVPLTITLNPADGATIAEAVTQYRNICQCCEGDVTWNLTCDKPTAGMAIKVKATAGTVDYTDTVTVPQELKAHLVGGLDTYYQCDPDGLMSPMSTFDTDQNFHVVAPVFNTGEADAENVTVKILVTGTATIVGGVNPQNIGTVAGGGAGKATWLVHCNGEGAATIKMVSLSGTDENTGVAVPEGNICIPCPIDVNQIPVDIEIIQPESGTVFEVGNNWTVKAKITNQDADDALSDVNATLFRVGNAELVAGQPNPVPLTSGTDTLEPGEWAEATWQMVCTGAGDVTFWVRMNSDDPEMCVKSEERTVHQKVPADLTVEILSPPSYSTYIATSQDFALTANITNNGGVPITIDTATVTCSSATAGAPTPALDWTLAVGESVIASWTLHCDASGATTIALDVSGTDTLGKPHTATDSVYIEQYAAAHLEVEILEVTPDTTVNVCDEFIVSYKVKNTGEADATEVEAILSVSPDGSARPVAGIGSGYTQNIGTIPRHGESEVLTWNLHCKEACESTIVITAEGNDEYGWHQKQECQSTGSFLLEEGGVSTFTWCDPDTTGYESLTFLFQGVPTGLIGPFNFEGEIAFKTAGVYCCAGRMSAAGIVTADDMIGAGLLKDMTPCDDDATSVCSYTGLITVDEGGFNIINGTFEGVFFGKLSDGTSITMVISNGLYCSTMASTPLMAINEEFIEPASVTVKQEEPSAIADLAVTKEASGTTFTIGDPVTFTITVTNTGPADATSVWVYDLLPAGVNFKSWDADQGVYYVGSGHWSVGDLAVTESATLEIVATVNTVGDIHNLATVTDADQHDPVTPNNADMVTITGEAPEAVTEATINVGTGYNLISLPLIPEVSAIDTMTALLEPNLVNVQRYDAATDSWLRYNPPPAPFPGASDLLTMEDGWGYWVKMDAVGSFTFGGWELVAETDPPSIPPSYDVVEGWNLIGFKSTVPKLPEGYLAGIAGKYVMIYGFADGSFFIAGTPGHDMLQPGLGYWLAVKVDESGTIFP